MKESLKGDSSSSKIVLLKRYYSVNEKMEEANL